MGNDTRRMKVIPEPQQGTRSVLVSDGLKGAYIKGKGPLSYTCGSCGRTLLRNVEYKQVQHLVIKCPDCSAFNEIPAAHHAH